MQMEAKQIKLLPLILGAAKYLACVAVPTMMCYGYLYYGGDLRAYLVSSADPSEIQSLEGLASVILMVLAYGLMDFLPVWVALVWLTYFYRFMNPSKAEPPLIISAVALYYAMALSRVPRFYPAGGWAVLAVLILTALFILTFFLASVGTGLRR